MSPTRQPPFAALLLLLVALSCLLSTVLADDNKVYIKGTGIDGKSRDLEVSRYPALYTGDFDDCLGGSSLFNVTKFDAAYYADNLTVLFHLDGTSNIRKESLILHISVEAYGENRFNMTYDPCKANIASMCPLNAGVPVTAFAVIPISPSQVSGIPSIALGIPDLEGFARLQIFANSTQTEIGCFQAVMTNGNSFSQPQAVSAIMGVLTFVAVLASFATAIYGLSIAHMRMHYAHSFSVLVIFETFQSIFFSGALSVNWPSVLPAWWSNFAWSAGMFANDRIVRSISSFTGTNANISQVGGAGSVPINNGGGLSQQIYGRSLFATPILQKSQLQNLARRAEYNASNPYDYTWNGRPRTPGMPMPGTWPGFGGTLSMVNVPPAEAFMVGLIWLLAVLGGIALLVVLAKLLFDLLAKMKWIKTDGFDYFRSHVGGYVAAALLRTLFVAFFTVMTLAMYQFSIRGPAGPTAVAVIVWLILLFGIGGIAAYACHFRLRHGKFEAGPDTVRFERGTIFKKIPFVAATRASQMGEEERADKRYLFGTIPFFRIRFADQDPSRATVHQDEGFIKRFGWLAARYRRTRWWFFAVYLGYLFVRACFIGGGARTPLAQVFGLFIFEILALLAIIKMNPFESNRNTAVAVWMLSISKIATTGLSIAFLPDFNLNRIIATVLGIIIIVVQGFLAVAVLVLIGLGTISTWMSLSRNREEFPELLEQTRIRFFEHMDTRAGDLPPPPKEEKKPEDPIQPYFNVREVRRAPKIEDEDEAPGGLEPPSNAVASSAAVSIRRSRANSASSRHSVSSIPRAVRAHRPSWSAKDFGQWDAEMSRGDVPRAAHSRNSSLRLSGLNHDSHGTNTPSRRPPMTPMRESLEDRTLSIPAQLMGLDTAPGSSISESEGEKKSGSSVDEKPAVSSVMPTASDEPDKKAKSEAEAEEQPAVSPLTSTSGQETDKKANPKAEAEEKQPWRA
ncbi:Putative membrane protein [Tolypocladium paradoxum]|uniref:Membrane protein n=1 Tax=Tolypocladium paradoxum TaxID=94208 RepID=A0A2S4L547_9HYPO|nr:Putative membrane protein [Tolypocladium paradoxum]